jgi:hypothetical protein
MNGEIRIKPTGKRGIKINSQASTAISRRIIFAGTKYEIFLFSLTLGASIQVWRKLNAARVSVQATDLLPLR